MRFSGVAAIRSLHPVKRANCAGRKARAATGRFFQPAFLQTNLFQFAGVEPETAAARALVHFHLDRGTEEMALEFHLLALRAFTFAGRIHDEIGITRDLQQRFAGGFFRIIHLLQFITIKPEAAATAATGVNFEGTNRDTTQTAITCGTFHRAKVCGPGLFPPREPHGASENVYCQI